MPGDQELKQRSDEVMDDEPQLPEEKEGQNWSFRNELTDREWEILIEVLRLPGSGDTR